MSLVSFWTGSVLDLARWGVEVGVVPDPLYLGNILFLLGVFSPCEKTEFIERNQSTI